MKIFPGGAEQHMVHMHGKDFLVIWWPPTYGLHPKPDGVVATVLPREALRAMHNKYKKSRLTGQKKKLPKKSRQRGKF